jgi:hypothetical protein
MDVNHKTYNNDLRKIAFVLSFMAAGAAATWKTQFIEEAYAKPAPANPNNRLGTYTQFRKYLMEAFSMFDSVGDALDELRSLRKKKNESIDEHIARFKLLVAELKIAPVACTFVNNPSASVDKPLCTVPMILLQCYCN